MSSITRLLPLASILMVLPAAHLRAQSATQPSRNTPPAAPAPIPDSPARNSSLQFARPESLSEAQRLEVLAFVKANMPMTWALWEETQDRPAFRMRRVWLLGTALFQFRRYTNGSREYPDFQDAYMSDVKITDEIIGTVRDYVAASNNTNRQEELRVVVRTKMKQLADSLIAERRRRIERIKRNLDNEERSLARDEKYVDEGVDLRLDEMISRLGWGNRPGTLGFGPPTAQAPTPPPGAPSPTAADPTTKPSTGIR